MTFKASAFFQAHLMKSRILTFTGRIFYLQEINNFLAVITDYDPRKDESHKSQKKIALRMSRRLFSDKKASQ